MDIPITRNEEPKEKYTDESTLGFGKIFTDHMLLMYYDQENGWQTWKSNLMVR